MDLFKELIPSILNNTDILITQDNENEYPAWIINKALSFHYDTVLYANLMNMNSHIDNKLQYDFLRSIIRKKKRPFQKWHKFKITDDINLIKEYFNYSTSKAIEVRSLLSDDDMEKISRTLDKGGTKK